MFWKGLAVALATVVISQGAVAQQTAAIPIPKPVTDAIDQHFRDFQTRAHIPGMVWGVVEHGHIVHLGTAGTQDLVTKTPVGADTLFRIASMSKAFTALAILKLRDDGKLRLDEPAETYVPELKSLQYPTSDSPRIRVRDLLSHVAGFVTDDPWGDRQQALPEADFTAMLNNGIALTRPPQSAFEYSNLGYALLGRVITNVSGTPFDAYITREILHPLGMTATGYDVFAAPKASRAIGYRWENEAFAEEPTLGPGVFGAMGGIQTSANDYTRWVAFLLDAWPARDGADTGPVKRATVRELAQGLNFPQQSRRDSLDGASGPCEAASNYAMGFSVVADCDLGTYLTHSGGYPGYGSNVLLLPDAGIGVFAFASRTYAGPSGAVRQAALELARAGLLQNRSLATSPELAHAYDLARAMFSAGSVAPGENALAMNFLLDRSAANWAKALGELKTASGKCDVAAPITATGLLSGKFSWGCDTGRIDGELDIAPNLPAKIQSLRLKFVPKA
jgi:CubicO group peptidase (beta-lactamase class C family)